MDVAKLREVLSDKANSISLVILTVTNNAGEFNPSLLKNIKATAEVCKQFALPLFIDGCRFAENAYFIKQREQDQANRSIKEIVLDMFSHADGITMSTKKDGLSNA